jgi:archaea-specific RecJ-like exonuclease
MPDNENTGIVSSIKISHNISDSSYHIVTGGGAGQFRSREQLELYNEVGIEGDLASMVSHDERKGKKRYGDMLGALVESADIKSNIKKIKLHKRDYGDVAEALIPMLSDAANTLLRGFLSGAPIVVRFHNDGDGSAGAIAIYRAFESLEERLGVGNRGISWQMNKSIAYTTDALYMDRMFFSSYKSIERPIVLITDFGTSPESVEAIKLSQEVCDLVWLDHHVPYEGFPKEMIKHYINVFDAGGDSSFTAGLETCILAEIISGAEVEDLKDASLISDYSKYADFGNAGALRTSVILDFLTSSGDSNSKPRQMNIILNDREKAESTFRYASSSIEEALNTGIRNIKSYKSNKGINVCVLDFGHIADLGLSYPLPGRYSSRLQSHIEANNNGNTIIIVHYGNYISIRVSKDISNSVDLLGIIERLKAATDGAVSGGGHMQAASVKTTKESMKETLRMLLVELGVRTHGS